jgi:hypothetical protein
VKIIDDEESAAQQVFTKIVGLRLREQPGPDFQGVNPWPVKKLLIGQQDCAATVFDIDCRQPLYAPDEMRISLWPVAP